MSKSSFKAQLVKIRREVRQGHPRYSYLDRIATLAFLIATAILLAIIPALAVPMGVLMMAGLIAWFGIKTTPESDNEDPDGGWDSMRGRNLVTTVIVLLTGGYGSVVLLLELTAALVEHYIEIGAYVGSLFVIFGLQRSLGQTLEKRSDHIDVADETCWVCATDTLKGGIFSCPICGFVSKAKNPFQGLCAHMDNRHHDEWRNTSLFKNLCESCQTNRFILTYLRSKASSEYGH